jgi:hypothetical protein
MAEIVRTQKAFIEFAVQHAESCSGALDPSADRVGKLVAPLLRAGRGAAG